MYKNKTAVLAVIVAVFALTSVASAELTTSLSPSVSSKISTITTPPISTSKPSVNVVSTGVTTQTTATTDTIIAPRSIFISADYVTPGTFNSATGTGGDYGFPGNIFLVPTTNVSSSGVIYKGTNRFIHNFTGSGSDGRNTFVGLNSGNFTMAGSGSQASYNTEIDTNTLVSITTGFDNTASGADTLYANTSGSYNTANGRSSLGSNTTGNYNTANGQSSLVSNITGDYNTTNGYQSLYFNVGGSENTANGSRALFANVGSYNTAVGMDALYYNTTGNYNVANGHSSLVSNTTGSNNTAYGSNSGYNSGVPLRTMTNSTFLGYGANSSLNGITNSTAIGAGAQVTKSNQVVIGNTGVTETLLRGKVSVGSRICVWNGASYTSMSFAPNSIVPVYATSTSC